MEIEKKKIESGAAGKPGESTAVSEKITLSASGMADLLKSEFAAEAKPEPPPAHEIPAAGESGVVQAPEKEVVVEQDGAETPEAKAEREAIEATAASELAARAETNGVTVEEQQAAEEAEAAKAAEAHEAQLPADAQAELDRWAETGGPLPPALQAVVGKRIGKLTAAREAEKARADQAEEKLKAATAEAEALKADPNRPAHGTPPTVMDEKTVATMATTAQKLVTEIENYLDDTATDEERGRVERHMQSRGLDEKGLKRELRQVNAFLTQELPKLQTQVRQFKADEAQMSPVAKARFPWLTDKARPEYALAQQVLGMMPEIRQRTPAHELAVGAYVLGVKVLTALKAAGHEGDAAAALEPLLAKSFPAQGTAAKSATVKTPPPKSPAGGSAAPGKTAASRPLDAASAKFNKTPNRQSATELARAALMAA